MKPNPFVHDKIGDKDVTGQTSGLAEGDKSRDTRHNDHSDARISPEVSVGMVYSICIVSFVAANRTPGVMVYPPKNFHGDKHRGCIVHVAGGYK
jgi:hypothetical protein